MRRSRETGEGGPRDHQTTDFTIVCMLWREGDWMGLGCLKCVGVWFAKRLPIGKVSGMKATVLVDEVGRMVLPKSVREAIGITGRVNVSVEVVAGAAQISVPENRSGAVARRRGRTVYTGPLPPDWDSGEAVSRMRERRMRR
jgi:bifunctional DNA-binding transcriptional regulator/antitoxin component of YhaV-PrlF toxin-antitoxin module